MHLGCMHQKFRGSNSCVLVCVCNTVTNVVVLFVVRSLYLPFMMQFCHLHNSKSPLESSWSPEWRWPEKHWGHLELDGWSRAEPSLRGTGKRALTGRISWALLFLCRWNLATPVILMIRSRDLLYSCLLGRTQGRVVGSMLWRFCEEADGKWVCFHGNENGEEKKVPTTKLVLQFVHVRELFSFSGLPGNSGSLPKAVRIPPSRGWDKR